MQRGIFLVLLCAVSWTRALTIKAVGGSIAEVVKLLEGMLEKSKTDGENEQELYTKFKSYCDGNEAEKTTSVEDLTKEIGLIEAKIGGLRAGTGELSSECAQLRADLSENEMARETAENLRSKEHEDFVAEEKSLVSASEQLGEAIQALAKLGEDGDHEQYMAGMGGATNSDRKTLLLNLKNTVQKALTAASVFLPAKQKASMNAFLQKAPFTGTYSSQSGEVIGILKSMQETFKTNLDGARSVELAQKEAFEKFLKTKKEAYDTMKASFDEKQESLSGNDGDLAGKKTQLEEATKQKTDDEDFLAKLKVMCSGKAEEFEERKLIRANEEMAISQALAILDNDLSAEKFSQVGSTKAASFVQLGAQRSSRRLLKRVTVREVANERLTAAAAANKSLKLARVAQLLEAGNPFTVVLQEIEKMIKLIGEEARADKEQLDWCNAERDTNHADLEEKQTQMETLKTEIEDIETSINDPETGVKAQIANAEKSLKANSVSQADETAMRREENQKYQDNVSNIMDAENILGKAVKILREFYAKHLRKTKAKEELSLLAAGRGRREDPKAPETWEGELKGQSEEGVDVISMIEFLLEETHKEEDLAHKDEGDAQNAFEDSMTALKKEETELQRSLVDLREMLATKEKEVEGKRVEYDETDTDKRALERYLDKIKPGCDFITENFDMREKNRDAEKTALEEAIKLLKESPSYASAVTAAEQEAMDECKETCIKNAQHADCKACRAGISVPGYCAGHAGAEGC